MKKRFKSIFLLSFLAISSLMACTASDKETSTSVPDLNVYNEVVEDAVAKNWILGTYQKFMALNGVEIDTKVKEYSFKDVEIPIPTDSDISLDDITSMTNKVKIQLNTKMDYKTSIIGLTETEPNMIKEATNFENIYCSIIKPGLDPNNKDTVKMDNGNAHTYIKDNKSYNDISDKNIQTFFPYFLYAFGEYENINLAKEEAKKVPSKFYDPTPVFKKEDLPLNKKMTTFNGVDFVIALNKVFNKNSNADTRFLNFYTNGENLKMVFQLKREHLIQGLISIAKGQNITIKKEDATNFVNDFVTLNAFELDFIFTKQNVLDYSSVDIGLSVSIPLKNDAGDMESVRNISFDASTHSWYNFENPIVTYPKDLDSYKMYDLSLPDIEIPNIGGGDIPFEPF